MSRIEKYIPRAHALLRADQLPRVDFHIHTNWTDGTNSIEEVYSAAVRQGLTAILFSEHARATSEEWFSRFAEAIRSLPPQGCSALVGVETKVVDLQGQVDCSEGILSTCDLVIGSVHSFPESLCPRGHVPSPEEAIDLEFRLASALLDHGSVDILGHPFGMCLRKYKATPPDELMRELIRRAAASGVAFEVSSKYHADPKKLLNYCRQVGAPFSLGSDAHAIADIGQIGRVLREGDLS